MRPSPLPSVSAMAHHLIHLTSTSTPPLPAPCPPHGGCNWRPPSESASGTSGTFSDFQAYAAIAVIILLCALICGLALHGALRCFLRRPVVQAEQRDSRPEKDADEVTVIAICPGPAVAFYPGMDMVGADECAICLTEFVEGEEIRLMAECRHGFHGQCIEKWLRSHFSCPNCRRKCLVVKVNVEKAEAGEPSVQHSDIESQLG